MTKYIAIFEVEDDCNIETIDAEVSYTYESNGTYYGMREDIEFEKEKTAAWVPVDAEPRDIYECNACGWLLYYEDRTDFKYCPNCGARMVEPQESEDCRDCKKWEDCPCGKEGHENGTSIGYSIGECKNYEPCEDAISRQEAINCATLNEFRYKIVEDIKTLPSVTPKEKTRKGEWLRMSDLSEQEDDRYKCSRCGNVVHYRDKMNLYTFNSWCGRCGSNNGRRMEVSE